MAVNVKVDVKGWSEAADDFMAVAEKFPDLRLSFMREVTDFALGQVESAYYLDIAPGQALPTAYHQSYIKQVRKFIGPGGSWGTVSARSPYAADVEEGHGPRPIDAAEAQDIQNWAMERFGMSPRAAAGMVKRIEQEGRRARHLMQSVFALGTPRSQLLIAKINERAIFWYNKLLDSLGRGNLPPRK